MRRFISVLAVMLACLAPQAEAVYTSSLTIDDFAPSCTVSPELDLIIEEVYPIGYAEDGDCLDMVVCVEQETHTRVFYIVKSPLGLQASEKELTRGLMEILQGLRTPELSIVAGALGENTSIIGGSGPRYDLFMDITKHANQEYIRMMKAGIWESVGTTVDIVAYATIAGGASSRIKGTAVWASRVLKIHNNPSDTKKVIAGMLVGKVRAPVLKALLGDKYSDFYNLANATVKKYGQSKAIDMLMSEIDMDELTDDFYAYRHAQYQQEYTSFSDKWWGRQTWVDKGLEIAIYYDDSTDIVTAYVSRKNKRFGKQKGDKNVMILTYGIYDEGDSRMMRGHYKLRHNMGPLDASIYIEPKRKGYTGPLYGF